MLCYYANDVDLLSGHNQTLCSVMKSTCPDGHSQACYATLEAICFWLYSSFVSQHCHSSVAGICSKYLYSCSDRKLP